MRIAECFARDSLAVSVEMFPPKGEMPVETAREVMQGLVPLNPAFLSVTYSAGGSGNSALTTQLAKMAKDEYGFNSMAHLTCMNNTREDVLAHLAEFKAAGIENVLALRGDAMPGQTPTEFQFAKDLIPLAREAGFCVGAASYPEGHVDCLDFDASIRHLKEKQDAGAEFFVSQLFFDNECAFRYLDACDKAGITVPTSFGIMPFMSKSQISRMVFMCGASLPSPVIKLLARYEDDPASLRAAGIEYACEQMTGLAKEGVAGIHVYAMNRPEVAEAAFEALRNAGFLE